MTNTPATGMIEPVTMRPRDDLIRMVDMAPAHLELRDANGNGRTMVGYPVVFNQWTEISGWEGNFLERFVPGSLNKTLRDRGDQIKVLFNHGMDPSIGDKPLGKPSVMEPDETGLRVEVPLADTSYNKDMEVLLRDGIVDGMSVRFSVVRDEWDEKPTRSDSNPKGLPERSVFEARLFEFGPVTFPAYEATTAGVRARPAYEAWRTAHHTTPASAPDVSRETIIPAAEEAADAGTSETAPDTPPNLAPVGTDKRARLLREADRMDRLTAVALRSVPPKGTPNARRNPRAGETSPH